MLEGVNSLVQAAQSRARGYRNVHPFISMVYLLAGKLEFRLPHWGAAPAFAHTAYVAVSSDGGPKADVSVRMKRQPVRS